jgi:hypothetical protein
VDTLDLPERCDVPQLAAIVEPGRLAHALGLALAHATPQSPALLDCAVTKVHYRPGRGCRLVISARFENGRGRGEEQLYCGRLPAGARAAAAAPVAAAAAPRFGPASLQLEPWDLTLWAYPNDPDLPGLAMLADPLRVRARFASTPAAFGFERAPRAVRARRAKYVPGKRCGYVYDVSGWSEQAGAPPRLVYGKCHAGDAARVAHDVAWRVWHSTAVQAGRVRLPRPFAYDEHTGVVWQEGLAGRPLLKDDQAASLPGLAAEIGTRLAALHSAVASLPREMDHAFVLGMLGQSLAAARGALPASARATCELGERLLASGARFADLPAVTLHGSFRLSHVLSTPSGVAFIDIDGANAGDPGVDLGRFLAHLHRLEAQGSIAPAEAETTAREFRRGYQAAAIVPVSDERIGWATAVQLVSGGLDKALKRMDAGLLAALTRAAARCCPV